MEMDQKEMVLTGLETMLRTTGTQKQRHYKKEQTKRCDKFLKLKF